MRVGPAVLLRQDPVDHGLHRGSLFRGKEAYLRDIMHAIKNEFACGSIPEILLVKSVKAGIVAGSGLRLKRKSGLSGIEKSKHGSHPHGFPAERCSSFSSLARHQARSLLMK